MRESFEFRRPKLVLLWFPIPATKMLQFGKITVSAMHSDKGSSPVFCFDRGGTAYCNTATDCKLRLGEGDSVFSDDVFVMVQSRTVVLVPSLENTASELRKNSLPPLSRSNWLPGLWAAHTVKPAPSGPVPRVLNSTALPLPPVRTLLPIP